VDGDLVVSSDVLVENRHFRREWSTGQDIGWRAAVQNLADIDAMGAVPTALQVTLAAPPNTPVQWVLDFADGLRMACAPHGVGVVGGDLSASNEIHIGVTALGETHGMDPVTRADAVPGDVLAVSAPLGAAAAGLALLTSGTKDGEAVQLFLRPRPIIGAGLEAALRGASAMMDISDGLLRDATRIARASEVALDIASGLAPVHLAAVAAGKVLDRDPNEWALTGGEDHHILATFPNRGAVPTTWTVIGEVRPGSGVTVDGAEPRGLGWDHFES
jgi:thiamine-monophosphate kinase